MTCMAYGVYGVGVGVAVGVGVLTSGRSVNGTNKLRTDLGREIR